jgi:hypothetical protein
MSEQLKFVQAPNDERPICPHCRQEIGEIRYAERGTLNQRLILWCPLCRCVLGTASQFTGG